MNMLVLDTTKAAAFVCACIDEQKFYKIIPETSKHSECLLNEIELLLRSLNKNIKDINVFATVTGPGSFTGIRIAISSVKAFAYALNKTIVASNVFEVVQKEIKNGFLLVKNTGTACYFAEYENYEIKNTGIVNNNEIASLVNNKQVYAILQEKLDNVETYLKIKHINNYEEILLNHFVNKANSGKFVTLKNLSPFYMQLSQAERQLEEKND